MSHTGATAAGAGSEVHLQVSAGESPAPPESGTQATVLSQRGGYNLTPKEECALGAALRRVVQCDRVTTLTSLSESQTSWP